MAVAESPPPPPPLRVLTEEQVNQFMETGYLVVPNLVPSELVDEGKANIRAFLAHHGVDPLVDPESIRKVAGSLGGFLELFHADWQCRLRELPAVHAAYADLYSRTWSTCQGVWEHPFGPFNPERLHVYYDRVACRWPDNVVLKNSPPLHEAAPSAQAAGSTTAAASSASECDCACGSGAPGVSAGGASGGGSANVAPRWKPPQRSTGAHMDWDPWHPFVDFVDGRTAGELMYFRKLFIQTL